MTYAIDKSVPPPTTRSDLRRHKYPFGDMEVGDSFLVPGNITAHEAKRVSTAANHIAKRTGKKFAVRTTADGVRCWRTA